MVAISVEDDFSVAGCLDRNRFIFSALQCQQEGAVERRHHRVDIIQALRLVQAGMDEDGIARLCPAFPHHVPVAEPCAVICLQQPGEARFDTRTLIIGGVNVKCAALGRGHRFASRPDANCVGCFASRTVRVGQAKIAVVLGSGLQIQDASCKAFRYCVVQVLAPSIDAFAANSHQRHRLTPARFAHLSKFDCTVAFRFVSPEMAHSAV